MYNHHAALERTWAGQRVNWLNFCSQMAAIGITDQTGKPPTRPTAVKTWDRVRQQKAREQAARDKRRRARAREPDRGLNANRPPPVVTAPTPLPPIPYYPPPPPTMPPLQNAMHSRPNAPPIASGAKQTPEEMRADIKAIIKRRSQYF